MQRFAFELRKLRAEAGGITYRALAQRAGYSITTLSQAAGGEQFPTLSVVLAYVQACGGDPVEWEARWKQAADEAAASAPEVEGEGADSPYKGLARFETEDHGRFFGRDKLTADLLELLRRQRFAAVFGPSGSGKSSLLRAGLIPALQHTREAGLRPAAIRILTPGERPERTHARVFDPSDTGPDAGGTGADTFVIVDQFEEIFTLCQDPAERARFLELLLTARRPESRLRVLIAVRADFYGRCAEHDELTRALRDAHLLAGPMSPAELREVIVKPAAAAGLTVERALTSRLVDEVADARGGLPLLSHVLLETWRRRRGKTLTLAGYEAVGGLDGAVAKTAEGVHGQFTEDQAGAARRVLLRLVTPGDGTPDTRRPAEHAELQDIGGPAAHQVLETLTRARLLTQDDDTVDLAHETLLTAWPRLRNWIEQDRERLRVHRKLTEAAGAWEDLDRDAGALYRGTRLATAQEHFGFTPTADLTGLEHAFLTASLTAREQEHRHAARTTRRLRALTATLSVLLALALTAGVIAWQQSRTSDQQRHNADAARQVALSRQLAAQSASLIGTDSDLASLLAVRAYRTSPTSQAVESLYAAAAVPLKYRLAGHATSVVSVAFSADGRSLASVGKDGSVGLWDVRSGRLRGDLLADKRDRGPDRPDSFLEGGDPTDTVAFSPDGRTLAIGIVGDQRIQLWDLAGGRVRGTLGKRTDGSTVAMAFSPDGRTLAAADLDHGVALWNTDTGRLRRRLSGDVSPVWSLAFSPDGHTLVTGTADHGVKLWTTTSGRLRRSLLHQTKGAVDAIAFSPDGHALATSSVDRGVELWDTDTGRLLRGLTGDTSQVASLAFSPDGRTLATVGRDRSVLLWDAASGRLRTSLPGHTAAVISLAFSPDGHSLATGSEDGVLRLWDLAADQSQRVLSTPPDRTDTQASSATKRYPTRRYPTLRTLNDMAFSPGGRTLASHTVGNHGVLLRDAATGRIRKRLALHDGDVEALAFSPDGHTLATGDFDHGVELWNTSTGRLQRSMPGFGAGAEYLAFSPDGHTLATSNIERGVELWNPTTGHLRHSLPGFPSDVKTAEFSLDTDALAFSPDGHTLATGGMDRVVRLWDVPTGRLVKSLPGHTTTVVSLAFSPDGRTLAAGSDDHAIRLWDTATGRIRASLTGYTGKSGPLTFSPDGRTLAAGAESHTLRLWDATTGSTLATLQGHTSTVLAVTFSPDRRTLTTAGLDHTLRTWNATPRPDDAIRKICHAIGRGLTPQEDTLYLPDQPHHTTCTT
ncbi:nSTAND1 domain-containing NTPase [Streptomyces sp. NPDC054794]